MKVITFIAALISAWLAYGAFSLHQKDPAHYGLTLTLVLGAATALLLLVTFAGKAKSKA